MMRTLFTCILAILTAAEVAIAAPQKPAVADHPDWSGPPWSWGGA